MSFVEYKTEGHVGIITMSREKALNAINDQVLDDLEAVLAGVDLENIRALIITGAGKKAFVAGADIGSMADMPTEEGVKFGRKGNELFLKIERFPIPIVAAVNGFALGGGCELALACDIRIASDNAMFALPETGLGIIPSFGGTQRLPRLINVGIAKEMLYTGKRVMADEALKVGLVNAVYTQDELMDKAMELANRIASKAPIGVRAAKAAVNYGISEPMEKAIEIELENSGKGFGSQDQRNAMKAFIEKRKPDPFINK
ncbi:MAG: enoyl-CoA hydratase/isomerase family protein [Clostridia bacterium]|nr:enoyl-CoA hydratase/isomerase family protein [Clostridia bacterium]